MSVAADILEFGEGSRPLVACNVHLLLVTVFVIVERFSDLMYRPSGQRVLISIIRGTG